MIRPYPWKTAFVVLLAGFVCVSAWAMIETTQATAAQRMLGAEERVNRDLEQARDSALARAASAIAAQRAAQVATLSADAAQPVQNEPATQPEETSADPAPSAMASNASPTPVASDDPAATLPEGSQQGQDRAISQTASFAPGLPSSSNVSTAIAAQPAAQIGNPGAGVSGSESPAGSPTSATPHGQVPQ